MIDTVCLLIPTYEINHIFSMPDIEIYSNKNKQDKFIRNPNKTEKLTGKYYPRLTEYKKGYYNCASLRIEFSASKLLYLNNLDELEDSDFPLVIETLQKRLREMGMVIGKLELENASVSSIHFSKNILLKDGYTSSHLISEMNKVNLNKSFDFARVRFTTDGQALYAYTNSHQFVIYDKIADLRKGNKRAIDKNQTAKHKNIYTEFKKEKELKEIIRFEVRISKKKKLNNLVESLGYKKNLTFKELFNTEISKKVINNYWNNLIKSHNLGTFSITLSSKDMLQNILLGNKNLKPKQAVYLFGLITLSKDTEGIRQLRSVLSSNKSDRTWYRIVEDMKQVNETVTKNEPRDWVKQIDKSLEEYKPYKIKNYENTK